MKITKLNPKKSITKNTNTLPAISSFPLIWQVHSLMQLFVNLED